MNNYKFDSRKIIAKVVKSSIAGTFILAIDSIIQAIYAGILLDTIDFIAISSCFSIMIIFVAICEGIIEGTVGPIIEKYYSNNREGLQQLVNIAWKLGIITSVTITVIGILLSDWLLKILGTNESSIHHASVYLKIYFSGSIIIYALFVCLNILGKLKKTWYRLIYIIPTTFMNIILIPIFCNGYSMFPQLGVKAFAIVPIITSFVGIIISIIFIYKCEPKLFILPSSLDVKINTKDIIRRGLNSFLPKAQAGASYLCILYFINKFDGNATASFYIITRIDSIVTLPAIAIMGGIVAAITQARKHKIYNTTINIIKWGFIYMSPIILGLSFLCATYPDIIIGIFIKNPDIINIASQYLQLASMVYPFFIIMYISNGILYGKGKKQFVISCSIVSIFCIRLPLLFIFTNRNCSILTVWKIILFSYIFSTAYSLISNIIIAKKNN